MENQEKKSLFSPKLKALGLLTLGVMGLNIVQNANLYGLGEAIKTEAYQDLGMLGVAAIVLTILNLAMPDERGKVTQKGVEQKLDAMIAASDAEVVRARVRLQNTLSLAKRIVVGSFRLADRMSNFPRKGSL